MFSSPIYFLLASFGCYNRGSQQCEALSMLQCLCWRRNSIVANRRNCAIFVASKMHICELCPLPRISGCAASRAAVRCLRSTPHDRTSALHDMRMPGVEPGSQAWEACMMPLHYMRRWIDFKIACYSNLENCVPYVCPPITSFIFVRHVVKFAIGVFLSFHWYCIFGSTWRQHRTPMKYHAMRAQAAFPRCLPLTVIIPEKHRQIR